MFRISMIKLATVVALVLCLHISSCLFAQGTNGHKTITEAFSVAPEESTLTVGSRIPDFTLNNIIGYEKMSAKVSDFRGKLLILDFWSTTCTSCLKTLREVSKIESKFNDKVKFIAITFEDSATVTNKVFKRMGFTFPTLVSDVDMGKRFPHFVIPHYVWVNSEGFIVAITGYKEMTEENIEKVLNNKSNLFIEKNDLKIDKKFLAFYGVLPGIDSASLNGSLYLSTMRKHDPTLPFSQGFCRYNKKGIILVNSPIYEMYLYAYNNGRFKNDRIPFSRCVLEVNDPDYYTASRSDRDCYSYNLIFPEGSKLLSEKMKIMRNDLMVSFGLEPSWEKRETKCYVLKCLDSNRLKSPMSQPTIPEDPYGVKIVNQPIRDLVALLDEDVYLGKLPVVDLTGLEGTYTVNLMMRDEFDFADIKVINERLAVYGLKLQEDKQMIDMLILRDPGVK